ncbi:MAG: B-box zinc finger protein [Planctomycetota bacterium]
MPQRYCLTHKDRPAVGLCHQCHKPLCEECRYDEAPQGLFCSRECYDQHLAYHSRKRPAVRRSRLKSLVVGLVLLLVLGGAAAVVAQTVFGIAVLERIF